MKNTTPYFYAFARFLHECGATRAICGFALLSAAVPLTGLAELTLGDAIDIALRENPQLLGTLEKVEVAHGRAVQARLWPNPELELAVEEAPIESGGLSSSKNLIGLEQTIPFPGKKSLDRKMGHVEIRAAESAYLGNQVELVRRVKESFFRTLAAQEQLAVAEQLLTLARSLVEATAKRVDAGAATDQEQLRAEVEEERAVVDRSSRNRDLIEARQGLATLLGQPGNPIPRLHGTWDPGMNFPGLEDHRAHFLAQHPDLQAAIDQVESSELDLRRARLDVMPDPTLAVGVGVDEAANETIMDLHVSFPLPLFDRAQGRKRATRALAAMARFDLMSTEQRLFEQWTIAEARITAATEHVEAYRERILPKAERALQLVQRGYDAGRFSLLDLLDIQRTTAESKIAYYDKVFELHAAAAQLESLLPPPHHDPMEEGEP